MGLAPTLIKAGAALLGGILGKSKNEYVVPNYQKIRDKAEAAGFNPLTALAMAPGQVVQSQNYMGSAIADAGLALADGMAEKAKQNDPLEKLKRENELLKEKIINVTLRPKVPGVYAQREAIPTLSQAVGGSNGGGSAANSGNSGSSGAAPNSAVGSTAYNLGDPDISSSSDASSRVPVKPVYILGQEIMPTSGTSDTDAIASRYGEDFMSPSWFAGWGAFGTDAYNHAAKRVGARFATVADAFHADVARYKRHPKDMQKAFGADWWQHQMGD